MRNLLTALLTTTLFANFSNSQEHEIHFVDFGLDSAYKVAKAEGKLLFVDCYTTWCGPCKWMDANIFKNEQVANYFNENFINIKLDMEKGEGEIFAGWNEVRSYPTYIFMDLSKPRRELVHRTVGSMEADKFIQFAKDAQDTNVRIGESRKKYAAGERSPEFIKKYIDDLFNAGYSVDAREICYWHYQTIDWNNIDEADAKNILKFINGESHPMYAEMMNNMPEMEKVADKNLLYGTLYGAISNPVWYGLRKGEGESAFNKAMDRIDGLNYGDKEKLRSEIQLFYWQSEDFEKFSNVAQQTVDQYFGDNSAMYNSIAWTFYEKTTNKKQLGTALKMVEKSITMDKNYNNLDTKMRLLYALGKKKEAITLGDEITKFIAETPGLSDRKESHADALKAIKEGKDIKGMN